MAIPSDQRRQPLRWRIGIRGMLIFMSGVALSLFCMKIGLADHLENNVSLFRPIQLLVLMPLGLLTEETAIFGVLGPPILAGSIGGLFGQLRTNSKRGVCIWTVRGVVMYLALWLVLLVRFPYLFIIH